MIRKLLHGLGRGLLSDARLTVARRQSCVCPSLVSAQSRPVAATGQRRMSTCDGVSGSTKHELPHPYGVYLVTDDMFDKGNLAALTAAAIQGGTTCVQLRLKRADTRRLMELGRELQQVCREAGVTFLVDDRVDVAVALGADGAHIGQTDLPPAEARKLLGPDKILGVTIDLDRPETVAEAILPPVNADYLGSNAVFPTSTKDTAVVGTEGLRETRKLVQKAVAQLETARTVPLIAIGGVTAENGAKCLRAGADGLAVVSAILGADDAEAASAALRRVVDVKTASLADGAAQRKLTVKEMEEEYGAAPTGPEPTRFGDWERKGRCSDF